MMTVFSSSWLAGFALVHPQPPVVAWVGWCPALRTLLLGGLTFASSDFRDFRAHIPLGGLTTSLIRLGDISIVYLPPSLQPIAIPAAESIFLSSTPLSPRLFRCFLRAARSQQKPPLPRRLSPSILLTRRALRRELIPPLSLIGPRSSLRHLATRGPGPPCRLRDAPPLGHADK